MNFVRSLAAQIGTGLGVVYLFFLIPSIEELFARKLMLLIRQSLSMSFAVCLLFGYEKIISSAERLAPKIIAIINILFTGSKKNNGS